MVIGDSAVLSLDPLWRSFLNYVYAHNGWKGPSPTWNTEDDVDEQGGFDTGLRELALADMNEFARRIEALTLAEVDGTSDNNEQAEANFDRPWVEEE